MRVMPSRHRRDSSVNRAERLEQAEKAIASAMRFEYGMSFTMALDLEAGRIARERAEIDARELIREALAIRDGKR